MFDTDMLIGKKFVAGGEAGECVLNPRTEDILVDLPEASLQQVDAAVVAAEGAFASWSRTSPAERSALLLKLADAIERDTEAFAALEALNCGKPRIRVLNDEIPAITDCFRFFAGAHDAWPGGGGVYPRPYLDDPARSDRRRRLDRAVELSHDDGGVEARPRPRRRQ